MGEMMFGLSREQWEKNFAYSKALHAENWVAAVHALQDGAQVGYVDPDTNRLDIEMVRRGKDDGSRAGLMVLLEKIYKGLAALPEASEVVANIVDQHITRDLALARPADMRKRQPLNAVASVYS